MMEGYVNFCVYLLTFTTCVLCDRLELPAFEYLRRFHKPLVIGQCAQRIVQYPEASYVEPCLFPSRTGETDTRDKQVDSRKIIIIHNAKHILQHIGMCNDESAAYFGLLSKGDCIANEIATKMSFRLKTVAWMYMEHYRPKIIVLEPSQELENIPDEYSHYLNNTYYTENIGIGTEEAILVELRFKSTDEATKASTNRYTTLRISDKLLNIARTVGLPRKVKVIRLSTAEIVFETEVFKGQFALYDAVEYVKQCEKQISRIRQELHCGSRISHLKYGFKAYEIGPIALPLSSVTEVERRTNWVDIALLQVEAKRTHLTNKRYRKYCRTQHKQHKHCLLMKQTIKELKRVVTMIHTQRRDWSKISYDQQVHFIAKVKQTVKLLKTTTNSLSKVLRKLMKKKT